MPKATTPTSGRGARRHNPLEDDLVATGPLRMKAPKRKSKGDGHEDEDNFVDAKSSKKILAIGRELMEESEMKPPRPPTDTDAFTFDTRFDQEDDDNNEAFGDDAAWADVDDIVEEIELEPEELATFNRFLPTNDDPLLEHGWDGPSSAEPEAARENTNLADLILAKIAAHEAGDDGAQEVGPVDEDYELPPKVVEVFTKIGIILSRWRSGKLPKPFKMLPTLPHWEDIIELTKPDEWTPNACLAATKIWVSHRPVVVQRFIERILLERVRDDIHETKQLNVHLMEALKKALYKPASFFKGFLFPLVASGTCTLREAKIVSRPLSRTHIPVLHSAAAIKGLCDIAAEQVSAHGTEAGGATNFFIKTLLEKNVDPASVKEGEIMDFTNEKAATKAKLPVIWHQCLLAFAQRYKSEITEDQRESLLDLLLTHGHHTIGPEVRRELLAGRGRGVVAEPEGPAFDGDDTMLIDG
ncbi:bystin [Pseudomassariella vexata]|uniref:Bystin n=1 Tax=Pseudomassariella vexata TaxID=1141098 RepID=A0A1Y2DVB6_9PEZI|nr:bystin [Pseudomassariella vexata]ORY63232.1 bystin [Pseudomassariella vexata]